MNIRLNDNDEKQATHEETPFNASIQDQLTGKTIEGALINAKKWEVENLNNIMPSNDIIKLYLGCDPGQVYRHETEYRPPLMNNYLANLVPYIQSTYRSRDDLIIDYLDNNTILDAPAWNFIRCRKGSTFMGSRSIQIGNELIALAGPGYMFIEDTDGFRMIIFISVVKRIGSDVSVSMTMFTNKSREETKPKILRFIAGFNDYCRVNKIYRRGAFDIDGNEIILHPVSWNALKVSAQISTAIEHNITGYITHLEDFKKEGIRSSRGIILTGRPGNGKTLLGRVLATNMGIPLLWVTSQQMSFAYGNNNPIMKLYQFAEVVAPVIILIEDADIFLENRQRNAYSTQLSELLNRIDGLKQTSGIMTIITANNPEMLDDAVGNRPKRFDVTIEFPNPAVEQRLDILEDIVGKKTRPKDHYLLEDVADRLDGFSAAHVTEFAERLIMAVVFEEREFINELMVNRELHNFGFKQVARRVSGFQ